MDTSIILLGYFVNKNLLRFRIEKHFEAGFKS